MSGVEERQRQLTSDLTQATSALTSHLDLVRADVRKVKATAATTSVVTNGGYPSLTVGWRRTVGAVNWANDVDILS